jgi:hypothetical protein
MWNGLVPPTAGKIANWELLIVNCNRTNSDDENENDNENDSPCPRIPASMYQCIRPSVAEDGHPPNPEP